MLVFIVKKLSNTPYANQIEVMQRTMNKPFSEKLRIASLEIKRCIFSFQLMQMLSPEMILKCRLVYLAMRFNFNIVVTPGKITMETSPVHLLFCE